MKALMKFVLDRLFFFMFVVSCALFVLEWNIAVNEGVWSAVEAIDFTILGGYYGLFGYELWRAKSKLRYVKSHWVLCVLLVLPFVPFARFVRVQFVRRVVELFGDTAWHVLDQLEML